jgi:pantetheine-phosphate adenylyltransferase
MSKQVVAIYPGTFDPISLGHEDIVLRAAAMFDKVILAVATAHHKKTLFTLEERMDMAREAMATQTQVEVVPFRGLARDFVRAHNASVMVRGVRTVTDFDYEFQLAGMNRELMPEVETVILTPSAKYQFISSTFVREIALLGGEGDGQNLVSAGVYQRLMAKKTASA